MSQSTGVNFDKKAYAVLETIAKVEVDRYFQAMTTIIICPAAENFYLEEKTTVQAIYIMNNRETKFYQLRQELNNLISWFKVAGGE